MASALQFKSARNIDCRKSIQEGAMSKEKPQKTDQDKHPQEYTNDLNPNAMAGQNINTPSTVPMRSAYDIKDAHRRLRDLLDDDLRQILVQPEGTRLKQGATYVDLNNLEGGEFTATGDMTAGPNKWYVAKNDIHYNLWNLLIGVDTPERLGTTRE
jgi:hypothetical protein